MIPSLREINNNDYFKHNLQRLEKNRLSVAEKMGSWKINVSLSLMLLDKCELKIQYELK